MRSPSPRPFPPGPWKLAALAALFAGSCGSAEPSAWIWAADRERGRVIALDARLRTVEEVALPSPRALAAAPDGTLWVSFVGPGRDGPASLVALEPDGSPGPPTGFREILGLCATEACEALVVEPGAAGVASLWSVSAGGRRRSLARLRGGRTVAASGRRALLGGGDGALVLVDTGEPPAILAWRRIRGDVERVGAGPPGSWWALAREREEAARLYLLGAELAPRWSRSLPVGVLGDLLPAEEGGAVWVADGERSLFWKVGFSGDLLSVVELGEPRTGVRALAALPGGVLAASSGAILALDENGALESSQGGFSGLVALERARPDPAAVSPRGPAGRTGPARSPASAASDPDRR